VFGFSNKLLTGPGELLLSVPRPWRWSLLVFAFAFASVLLIKKGPQLLRACVRGAGWIGERCAQVLLCMALLPEWLLFLVLRRRLLQPAGVWFAYGDSVHGAVSMAIDGARAVRRIPRARTDLLRSVYWYALPLLLAALPGILWFACAFQSESRGRAVTLQALHALGRLEQWTLTGVRTIPEGLDREIPRPDSGTR
jgi:hypothetical protein